jgi:cation diffusion facilitator family transporter
MTNAQSADQQKSSAALSSVVAAVGLTAFKLVVGVLTGSLGILAEAAHSGLDLVAALVTFLAVRVSGKPADREHLYGHGKIENLSALFETLLLLATCVWIIYEAVNRLFFKNIEVQINAWAFVVMITSIVIDVSRSRMLYRVARKFNSQALEADALHFSTDIWSSSVVIAGLVCVKIAEWVPSLSFLKYADSVAALGVAAIVIYISGELGMRTIQALLDTAPKGMVEKVKTLAETIPGVVESHNIRIRHMGPHIFADIHILIDGNISLNEAHDITHQVEQAIQVDIPGSDITVHPEPAPLPTPEVSE